MKLKLTLKKILIIVLPVVFAVGATVVIALAVGGAFNRAPEELPEAASSEAGTEGGDVPVIAPVEELYSAGLAYRKNPDGCCAVVGLGECTDEVVRIPMTSPDGFAVTGIADNAFNGAVGIKEVIIPDTVMSVGAGAFRGSSVESVTIGSGVMQIGEYAFAKCLSLREIKVSGANAVYASDAGVLYDRGFTKLICYPSGRTAQSYDLPKTLCRVESLAMASCKYLAEVHFGGTEKAWKKVYVAPDNDTLGKVCVTFAPAEK